MQALAGGTTMRNWVAGVVGVTLAVACGGSTPPGSTSDPAGDTRRSDLCAGLMPKLPAAQTFVSPGYGSDGSCGSATTDGMGTVYSVENGRGGGIYSNAGGIVKSENLFVPLASGFSTFPQAMMATGSISGRGPDGTLASLGSYVSDRYVTVFAGKQANGGSVIVAVNPGVDCSKTNDLQIIRFDDHFAKTSDVHVLNRGCTPGYGSEENDILVDAQDRTLMVYVAQGGDIHRGPDRPCTGGIHAGKDPAHRPWREGVRNDRSPLPFGRSEPFDGRDRRAGRSVLRRADDRPDHRR